MQDQARKVPFKPMFIESVIKTHTIDNVKTPSVRSIPHDPTTNDYGQSLFQS